MYHCFFPDIWKGKKGWIYCCAIYVTQQSESYPQRAHSYRGITSQFSTRYLCLPINCCFLIMYELHRFPDTVTCYLLVNTLECNFNYHLENSMLKRTFRTENMVEIVTSQPSMTVFHNHMRQHTFIMSGSLHGPLLDLRHPPSAAHVHEPPKKSGSWLEKKKRKRKETI